MQIAQQWMKSVVAPLDDETAGSTKYYFDRGIISEILEKAVEKGELGKDTAVDIVSKNIMNSYYGAVSTWCITNGKEGSLTENLNILCEYVLNGVIPDISQYDTIIIGGPVWGYTQANPVTAFMKSANVSGKKMSAFWTFYNHDEKYNHDMKKESRGPLGQGNKDMLADPVIVEILISAFDVRAEN